jgi:hypothetical protein
MKYVILFFILCFVAQAQRQNIKSGYGLKEVRDSNLVISLDPVRVKTIGDSLGYGTSADSIARVGRVFTYTARARGLDTTMNFNFFAEDGFARATNGEDDWSDEAAFTAPTSLLLWRVAISHLFKTTSTTLFSRDTVVGRDLSTPWALDSVQTGEEYHVRYVRAQATVNSAPADVQQIWPIVAEKNQLGVRVYTLPNNRFKVPELLGVSAGDKGVSADHWIVVTLWFIEKVPGRKYW